MSALQCLFNQKSAAWLPGIRGLWDSVHRAERCSNAFSEFLHVLLGTLLIIVPLLIHLTGSG